MRTIRTVIGATTINPDLLTYAEKLQYEGYLLREDAMGIIKLAGAGASIKEIVRRTGHRRKLVRQVVRGQRTAIFRVRQSSLKLGYPSSTSSGIRAVTTQPNSGDLYRQKVGTSGCRQRMVEAPTARGTVVRSATPQGTVRQNDRAADDSRAGSSEQG